MNKEETLAFLDDARKRAGEKAIRIEREKIILLKKRKIFIIFF